MCTQSIAEDLTLAGNNDYAGISVLQKENTDFAELTARHKPKNNLKD